MPNSTVFFDLPRFIPTFPPGMEIIALINAELLHKVQTFPGKRGETRSQGLGTS